MMRLSRPMRRLETTNVTASAVVVVPASRLVVRCNDKTRSVLQQESVEASVDNIAARNSTKDSTANATGSKSFHLLDWGGMIGGEWDVCDDWDMHQVSTGADKGNVGEIRSRNSVAQAAAMGTPSSGLESLSDGFGFAVWLSRPNSNNSSSVYELEGYSDDEEAPILTLGRPSTNDDDDGNIPVWKECGDTFDLELSYRSASQELVLRYSDVDGITTNVTTDEDVVSKQTCRTLRIALEDVLAGTKPTSIVSDDFTSSFDEAVHVAVIWSGLNNTLNVHGQGRTVLVTPLPQSLHVTLAQWKWDQDHLIIFRDGTFDGGLHQADLFLPPNLPETTQQVESLYQQGFVKTRYGSAYNFTGASDGSDDILQLDLLKTPAAELRRIAQDSTTPLTLSLGGMVRWRRNITALYGSNTLSDASQPERRFALWVNITRFPSHGLISLSNASATGSDMNRVGSLHILPLPVQQIAVASLEVDYAVTDRSFYNLPHHPGSDNAERLEAIISVMWKGEILATSPVIIPIQVQQVNSHPPVLTAPSRIVVKADGGFPLSNVSLHDPDAGSGLTPVRVDVSSRQSSLELDLDGHDDALTFMYDTCHQRSESPWQCVGGDGERLGAIPGRLVTFVSPMEDVSRILQTKVRVNLMRESDAIVIRVYDGQDDTDCLSALDHAMFGSNWTIHRGCYVAEADVELVADPTSFKEGAAGGSVLDTSSISRVANLLFWGLAILLVLGIVACLRRCMPRCLARGSCCGRGAIDADDGSDPRRVEARDMRCNDREAHPDQRGPGKENPDALVTTMSDDEFDDVASF